MRPHKDRRRQAFIINTNFIKCSFRKMLDKEIKENCVDRVVKDTVEEL